MLNPQLQKTLIFVFGTRPEFIKIVPIILEARKEPSLRVVLCSTGQHRDMLEPLYAFFAIKPDVDFELMRPNQNLVNIHADTMSKMINVIEMYQPTWIVVQGDTTSAHAAAMAGFYSKVPVAHVEAGLRTNDIMSPFPEEMNRRAIGLVATAHFCPTQEAAANLIKEGIALSSFFNVTGNTGIDTLSYVSKKIDDSIILQKEFLKKFSYVNLKKFILVTVHRRENFGSAQKEVLMALLQLVKSHQVDIVFPVHPNPNVRQAVAEMFQSEIGKTVHWITDEIKNYESPENTGRIFLLNPLDYPELVYLMKKCQFVMTDSGGIQEEAPSFGKKILVLRESTERPEGLASGFSELVGTNSVKIVSSAERLLHNPNHWNGGIPKNPYGDGTASVQIIKCLLKRDLQ